MGAAAGLMLTFLHDAEAVSIGEVVSQSRLGEPLSAQIDLMLGTGEHIQESCLKLTLPDPAEDDSAGYLTKANLSIKMAGDRYFVVINSSTQFDDVFAKLRLQISCPGMGIVTKTLTILPDPGESAPQEPIAAPSAPEVSTTSSSSVAEVHATQPAAKQSDTRNMQAGNNQKIVRSDVKRIAKPPIKNEHSGVAAKHSHADSFRLEISGEPMDDSRLGKVGKEGRELLLARQKLLDADEQIVRYMAMQRKIKLLQDELAEIKLQMSQLGDSSKSPPPGGTPGLPVPPAVSASPAVSTASAVQQAAVSSAVTATGTAHATQPASAVARSKPVVPAAPAPSLMDEILDRLVYLAGGLIVATGLAGAGYFWIRRRNQDSDADNVNEPLDNAVPQFASPTPTFQESGDFTHPAAVELADHNKPEEVDPIGEADLFLNFGRDVQAEEILTNALKNNPADQKILLKLLSIYGDRKDIQAFAAIARQLREVGDAAAWAQASEAGRNLEPENPFYGGDASAGVATVGVEQAPAQKPHTNLDFDLGLGEHEANNEVAQGSVATTDLLLDESAPATLGLDFDLGSGLDAPAEVGAPLVGEEAGKVPDSESHGKADTPLMLDFDLRFDDASNAPAVKVDNPPK